MERNRRNLLKIVAGASAAGVLTVLPKKGHSADECTPPLSVRLDLGRVEELSIGTIIDFAYPDPNEVDSAFLVRLDAPAMGGVGAGQNVVAFLRACPHMGCRIAEINIEKGVLGPCGCHRSRFDLRRAGIQIIGRASQNLVQVTLEVVSGIIYAIGVEGLPYGQALQSD